MHRTLAVAVALCCAAVTADDGAAAGPTSAPGQTSKPATQPKYVPATPEQAQKNHEALDDFFDRIKKNVTPNFHSFETPHFWVYSGWDKGADKEFGVVLENLYGALCRQFDIPEKDNIWAGKCGIFFFKEQDHFKKFTTDVDKSKLEKAGGYYSYNGIASGGKSYVALAPAVQKDWFYEVLTHEGTHAFMSRFLKDAWLPTWVDEGMAECTVALLIKDSGATRKFQSAMGEARFGRDPSPVFESVQLASFDYGIAQSFVAFLVSKDPAAFRRFVIEMKEGKSEAEALKDAYNWTQNEMLRAWKAAAGIKK